MPDIVERLREAAKFGGHYADAADEIERLRAVILDIARIVENPDSRAPRQVRDITDKESMRSDSGRSEETPK